MESDSSNDTQLSDFSFLVFLVVFFFQFFAFEFSVFKVFSFWFLTFFVPKLKKLLTKSSARVLETSLWNFQPFSTKRRESISHLKKRKNVCVCGAGKQTQRLCWQDCET